MPASDPLSMLWPTSNELDTGGLPAAVGEDGALTVKVSKPEPGRPRGMTTG